MGIIKRSIKNMYGKYLIRNFSVMAGPHRPNVLISYLPFPLRLPRNSSELRRHQNRREAVVISEVFRGLGFNIDIVFYKKKVFLPHRSYDVVFGLEPNFGKFARKNPAAIKIYYATGAYWKYQNANILSRTKEVNERRYTNLNPSRLVSPHRSVEFADWIIQIGSKFTISTYPREMRRKVILVRQSSFEFLDANLGHKDHILARKNFLWFGGKGAILKGLDLLLEAFENEKDLTLYIAGDIEEDFSKEYSEALFKTKNIHYLGWLDIASDKLKQIANSCAYVILPSASEGMPGSVISMMRLGLIPVVSRQAAFDGIEDFGVLIPSLTPEGVLSAIEEVSHFDKDTIYRRAQLAQRFAKENFTIEIFKYDLKLALLKCLNETYDFGTS